MNDLHCPQSFVKSIAPLSVSPSDAMSSFISSIQCSPGLTLFLFPSNEKGKHNLTLTDPHDDQLETNYRFSFRTGLLINMGGLISGEIVLAKCPGSVVSAISREMFERTAWIPSWNGTSKRNHVTLSALCGIRSRQWLGYGHLYAKRQPLAYGQPVSKSCGLKVLGAVGGPNAKRHIPRDASN